MFLINKNNNTIENIVKLLNLSTCKNCFKYKKKENIIIPVNKKNIRKILEKEEKENQKYKEKIAYSNDIYFYNKIFIFLSEILDILEKYYIFNNNIHGMFGTEIKEKYSQVNETSYISIIKEEIEQNFKNLFGFKQNLEKILTLEELLELTDDNIKELILEYGSFIKEKMLDKQEKINNWDIINQELKYRFDIINAKKKIVNEFSNTEGFKNILKEKNYTFIYKLLKEFISRSEIILEDSDKTYVVDNKIDNLQFLDKIFKGLAPNQKYYSNGLYVNSLNKIQEDFRLYYEIFFNILLNYKEVQKNKYRKLIGLFNKKIYNQEQLIEKIKKLNRKKLNNIDKKYKNIAIFYKEEIPKMKMENKANLLIYDEISF